MANNNHSRRIIAFATEAHLQTVKFLVKQHCMQLFIGVSINNGTRKVEFEHPEPNASKFCERPLNSLLYFLFFNHFQSYGWKCR
jgi:hypothetical protein